METCEKTVNTSKAHCVHMEEGDFRQKCCWCGQEWKKMFENKKLEGHGEFGPKLTQMRWEKVPDDNRPS